MAKHFAGPWTVDRHALSIYAPCPTGGERRVCDIRGWGALTGKGHGALGLSDAEATAIQTANAKLIAAAPDLLENLSRMVEHFGLFTQEATTESAAALHCARAALAKAARN
jgi:hypothetical protein